MSWHVQNLDHLVRESMPALMGLAWGYNTPGCLLVARVFPNNRVYLQVDEKFQKLAIEHVCDRARRLTESLGIVRHIPTYADEELFNPKESDTGVIVEPIADVFARCGWSLIATHGPRSHGWQRIHDYLREAPDKLPWLVASPNCKTLLRTMPALVQSKTDPDDCTGPDYAANALRHLISARPAPSAKQAQSDPSQQWGTVAWLKAQGRKPTGVLARQRLVLR